MVTTTYKIFPATYLAWYTISTQVRAYIHIYVADLFADDPRMSILPLWTYDSKLKYTIAQPSEVPAAKTIMVVWNSDCTIALDPQ